MWGIQSSPCSPEYQLQLDSASLPVTPEVDSSPCLTTTSNPFSLKEFTQIIIRLCSMKTSLMQRDFQLQNFKHQNKHVFWCHRHAKDLQCTKETATWELFNGLIWLIKLNVKLDESQQNSFIYNLWDAN